jgi:hypothetical protein
MSTGIFLTEREQAGAQRGGDRMRKAGCMAINVALIDTLLTAISSDARMVRGRGEGNWA